MTLIAQHEKDTIVDGVHIQALPRSKSRLTRMTATAVRILWRALREHADIYHFHDPELIPVGLCLRACGKEVIYDIHEDVPRDILDKRYLPAWSRRAISSAVELLERKAARYFSALVPVTPYIAQRLGNANSRIVRVSNFPRLDEIRTHEETPARQRRMWIGYVGLIAENRGISQMVDAVRLLSNSSNIRLKLAGQCSPPRLLADISALPGWGQVDFLGQLDRSRTVNLLGQVRAGLVLFHPDSQYPFSYPIKMFEYMAAGLPVIGSDFPLWREIIGAANCGILVDPLNPRAIADAIHYIVTNPTEAEIMGKRGRAAVEQLYNWQSEERKLLDLYANLLERVNSSR